MASVVRMPSVLAGATEAAIATWLVAPGDTVSVGDPLAEIETEKAIVEYSAEEAGVIGRLVLGAGDAGEIGAPIAVLVQDGETDADIDAILSGEVAAGAAPATGAPAVPAGASAPDPAAPSAPDAVSPSAPAAFITPTSTAGPGASTPTTPNTTANPGASSTPNVPATPNSPTSPSGPTGPASPAPHRPYESQPVRAAAPGVRTFASPVVRKMARERGIDLAAIAGTGPNGRIVRRDLERLAAGHQAPAAGAQAARWPRPHSRRPRPSPRQPRHPTPAR